MQTTKSDSFVITSKIWCCFGSKMKNVVVMKREGTEQLYALQVIGCNLGQYSTLHLTLWHVNKNR